MFDESDVKIDMSNENLKPQKIKVASNLLVESRVILKSKKSAAAGKNFKICKLIVFHANYQFVNFISF